MILYHYTTELGMRAIVDTEVLRPSRARKGAKDVRYGNGQYFSDLVPGTLSLAQLSRALVGIPFLGFHFSHFVAVDLSGIQVIKCRPSVYLVPNNFALGLSGRIVDFGESLP